VDNRRWRKCLFENHQRHASRRVVPRVVTTFLLVSFFSSPILVISSAFFFCSDSTFSSASFSFLSSLLCRSRLATTTSDRNVGRNWTKGSPLGGGAANGGGPDLKEVTETVAAAREAKAAQLGTKVTSLVNACCSRTNKNYMTQLVTMGGISLSTSAIQKTNRRFTSDTSFTRVSHVICLHRRPFKFHCWYSVVGQPASFEDQSWCFPIH
jgi:hypothetical protein